VGEQTFSLSWDYLGSKEIMGGLRIKSVVIVGESKKWMSDATISIGTGQGSTAFEAPAL
jgi:hypothetical protein